MRKFQSATAETALWCTCSSLHLLRNRVSFVSQADNPVCADTAACCNLKQEKQARNSFTAFPPANVRRRGSSDQLCKMLLTHVALFSQLFNSTLYNFRVKNTIIHDLRFHVLSVFWLALLESNQRNPGQSRMHIRCAKGPCAARRPGRVN